MPHKSPDTTEDSVRAAELPRWGSREPVYGVYITRRGLCQDQTAKIRSNGIEKHRTHECEAVLRNVTPIGGRDHEKGIDRKGRRFIRSRLPL